MMAQPASLWRDVKNWIALVARLVLGGALFYAGFVKVGDLDGSVLDVRKYQILPFDLTGFVGYALPIGELILGAIIILGLFTRLSAALGGLLMVVYIAAIISLWARGLTLDCGCFGPGAEPASFAEARTGYIIDILRDLAFTACAVWVVWHPPARPSLDRWLFPPLTSSLPPR